MIRKIKFEEITKQKLLLLFDKVDSELARLSELAEVVVIGGAAILMQDLRVRATNDIDLAPIKDAEKFTTICNQAGIEAQIVTVSTTVDFVNVPTIRVYEGHFLKVNSVTPKDLIKLKLERFQKQDPEDIYTIIQKTKLSYQDFVMLLQEMICDFVGLSTKLIMSARTVVEMVYPDKSIEFRQLIPIL